MQNITQNNPTVLAIHFIPQSNLTITLATDNLKQRSQNLKCLRNLSFDLKKKMNNQQTQLPAMN